MDVHNNNNNNNNNNNTSACKNDPSKRDAIERLSRTLSIVNLHDQDALHQLSCSPPSRTAKPRTTTATVTSTTKAKSTSAKTTTTTTTTTPHHHQQYQEPAIVRRSRRGDRAISQHPLIGRYRVELTSSERLWCGKFALGISTAQQLGVRLGVDEFDAIFAGDESRAFNARHGWAAAAAAAAGAGAGAVESNFYDEQLDFVLRVWGRKHGLSLQLGVVRDFEGVFVNRGVEGEMEGVDGGAERVTLWIHNDNAMLLGRPFNHYSGISVLEQA